MRTKLYMIALAAMTMILALSSCSESEDLLSAFHSDPNAVRITAQVGKTSADGFTRSYPLGDAEKQKEFKEDDEISVQADGQDAVTYKLVGSEWQPQGGKFLKWESETMNFTAYYPATFNGNITQPMKYDSENDLAAADFMSFSGPQTNTEDNNNQLTLTMNRQMARVVVDIAGFNDQYTGATIDNISSLSICGVKAYKHSDGKFYALIKPCEAQNSATFISLDIAEGESKTTETLTGIPALVAGNSYTYKLTVGKNKISVSGIYVANWTGGTITGGNTEECPTPYITFTAKKAQKFKMTPQNGYEISGLEYSVNNGDWQTVEAGTEVTFGGANGNLRLRGTNTIGTANDWYSTSTITFTDETVNVACTGDIRTLLDWRSYNIVETNNARFCNLFDHCRALTSAPELPAENLADHCYKSMFYECSSLKTAPKLPAKTMASECYTHMFSGCSSLKKAPELPAETLANGCYASMFQGCSALESAPASLPAKKMASQCYSWMFNGCSSLKVAPELPSTELARNCYGGMFFNCENLTTAPVLSATALVDYCYDQMFNGCTKLSSITIQAPSDQISGTSFFNVKSSKWLADAGTDAGVTSRTLKVKDKAAYVALVAKGLDENWKTGKCKVLDKDGNEITE